MGFDHHSGWTPKARMFLLQRPPCHLSPVTTPNPARPSIRPHSLEWWNQNHTPHPSTQQFSDTFITTLTDKTTTTAVSRRVDDHLGVPDLKQRPPTLSNDHRHEWNDTRRTKAFYRQRCVVVSFQRLLKLDFKSDWGWPFQLGSMKTL